MFRYDQAEANRRYPNKSVSGSEKKIVSLEKSLFDHYPIAPFPFCMTREVLQKIAETIGSLPPETGGKLFGPINQLGIDRFEFDKAGSDSAGATVYSPNVEWAERRRKYHLYDAEVIRDWKGDIHSHPGSSNRPSGKSGKGLGDMGYVEEVFAMNDAIQYFLLPIVTHSEFQIAISPYIVSRDQPSVPMIAPELKICVVEEFPEAEFPVFIHLSDIRLKLEKISSSSTQESTSEVTGKLSEAIDEVVKLEKRLAPSGSTILPKSIAPESAVVEVLPKVNIATNNNPRFDFRRIKAYIKKPETALWANLSGYGVIIALLIGIGISIPDSHTHDVGFDKLVTSTVRAPDKMTATAVPSNESVEATTSKNDQVIASEVVMPDVHYQSAIEINSGNPDKIVDPINYDPRKY